MNTFDSLAPPPTGPSTSGGVKNNHSSSRSPTDSALSSSFGSTRSHSSSSSRKHIRNQNPVQTSSQSTESTPINTTGPAGRNYQSTEQAAASQLKASQLDNANRDNATQPTNQDSTSEPQQSWYSQLADRYGSLELENKGSVARDHLALGTICIACHKKCHTDPPNTHVLLNRTNVPSLDAHLPRLRLNRHRSNTALPSEQRLLKYKGQLLRPSLQLILRHPATASRFVRLRFSRVPRLLRICPSS